MNAYKEYMHFREFHEKELGRKQSINELINIIIGVLSAFIAVVFYLTVNYKFSSILYIDIFFYLCIAGSILFLIFVTFYLVKASTNLFKGFEYEEPPYPRVLSDYYAELEEFYDGSSEDQIEEKYTEYLANVYKQTSDTNSKINDLKYEWIFLSKKYLVIIVLFLFPSAILFSINKICEKAKDKPKKVEVLELNENLNDVALKLDTLINSLSENESVMSDNKDKGDKKTTTSKKETPPTPPPPRKVREGKESQKNNKKRLND